MIEKEQKNENRPPIVGQKPTATRILDIGLIGAAIAIPLFVAVAMYYKITALWLILGLFGTAFFFPIGAFVGWWLFEPKKRAQLLRWIKRRNYGVIYLVHRQSGYMLPLVRDFNNSILIKDEALWVLKGGKIYRIDDKKEDIREIEVKPENIAYVGGVPVMFLDLESKRPLTFKGHDAREATPTEVGAVILGYVYNQTTKAIASLKKQWNWLLMGILALSLVSAVLSYLTMNQIEQVSKTVAALQGKVAAQPITVTPAPAEPSTQPEQNATAPQPAPIPSDQGVSVGGTG